MRIAFSLFILLVPIVVYFTIIRPRLHARFVDTYANIDGWWARQWARVVAFRTWIIGAVALIGPEIANAGIFAINALAGIHGMDISMLPDWLENSIRALALVAVIINQGLKTTPAGQPEPGVEPEKP